MDHSLINLLHLFKIIFIASVIIGILFKMKKMKDDEKVSIDIIPCNNKINISSFSLYDEGYYFI